jgi:hypothetical protein
MRNAAPGRHVEDAALKSTGASDVQTAALANGAMFQQHRLPPVEIDEPERRSMMRNLHRRL